MVLPVMVVRVGVVMTVRGSAVRLNGVRIEGCSHRVETSDTQQNLVGHLAVTGFDDAQTVEMSIEPGSDLCDLLGTGKVYLVEDQHVGKADLLELELHQWGILGVREDLVGIHHASHAVQPNAVPQIGIAEGREDPAWIGNPTGFEQDVFDGLWACEQSDHRLDEVVANLAADAAVGQADYIIVHAYDEFGVDIDGAKVVDEDSHAQAMIPVQNAIQQRGLSRPKKTSQDRNRYGFAIVVYEFHCFGSSEQKASIRKEQGSSATRYPGPAALNAAGHRDTLKLLRLTGVCGLGNIFHHLTQINSHRLRHLKQIDQLRVRKFGERLAVKLRRIVLLRINFEVTCKLLLLLLAR